ncbi:HelD family protein [Paenibacillus allorhizosphaerae]|uniref:DNA helicase IV n=1 Tax=Paenibacillus allorhizosphaerae TaxID=2849866 RepID=A0ABN7TSZ6_9BACL|nr:UvrD-helicase domain-containing protein [Paenibacillus allorhizosphaerae]CAG7654759.1 DNA helicase IV [Paenibacillus allorhizosphaerae]
MIINSTESEERDYVQTIVSKLRQALQALENKIDATRLEVIEAKKYVWTNMAGLDPAERAANRVDISLTIDQGERAIDLQRRLQKLMQSPYFGRVDFMADGSAAADAFYIGVHSFSEEDSQRNMIYDWRSPVASMFYDYNVGRAAYEAPAGEVEGEICLKRQYRIKHGVMDYMIESSMNINDDVLQKELSHTSDEKMKNIVATIQKEQNVIIRNEHSHELIIQGVAGSGKTSVALHRIAFLLYRYKGTITSQNILIISPNKVFSDYISNVLPELGEEKIMEIGFDELAARELKGICGFQTFGEQVSGLTASADEALIACIQSKAGLSFVHRLEQFVRHCSETYFVPADLSLSSARIAKEDIASAYQAAGSLPVKQRLDKTASIVAGSARDEDGQKLKPAAANKIKTAIKKMFKTLNMISLYKDFCEYIGKPEWFKLYKPKTLEFSDVFPIIYLKILLEGAHGFESVKHVLVDEMQDYTAVQYAVLSRLFKCKKTILGDGNQSVNPYSSSSITEIKQVFPEADTVELLKSYRSTIEIIHFARQINPNSRMIPIERHGDSPRIQASGDAEGQLALIRTAAAQFLESEHRSLGIVCKTQAQAKQLYQEIKDMHKDVYLLDFSSEKFHDGILIASSHMAKGLEFDQVIVPFCDAANYTTEMDRSLLYIACTRAMHKLTLTYFGEASPLLPDRGRPQV